MEQYLKNLWRWKCDLPEEAPIAVADLDRLKQTEWSDQFEQLMRNRMILGHFRYGSYWDKDQPDYDRVGSIKKRLVSYIQTGNKETLVDIANLCLIEFEKSNHPSAHFHAVDDGEHVTIK